MQIVWAKAGCGIWGLGHVFEGKLYFTKDLVDDSFVPRNRKPKPIPRGRLKRSARAVQLFGRLAVLGGSLKRSARAVQLFGRLAVLETHTL